MTTRTMSLDPQPWAAAKTPGMLRSLWQFVIPFWCSEKKRLAWSLLFALLGVNGLFSYIMLKLNIWSGHLFDAIQKTDSAAFYSAVIDFIPIVLSVSAIYMVKDLLQRILSYRWRLWLSQQTIQKWLNGNIFYRLYVAGAKSENPDQRIAEDIKHFTDMLVTLFVNFFLQLVMLVVFGLLLWKLSPPISFAVSSQLTLTIPGYMLWITLIFAGIATLITYKLGAPLVKLDYQNERLEANFRFHLMRIREYRNEVAILQSQSAEKNLLNDWLGSLWGNFKLRMKYTMYVTFSLNIFSNSTTVLPYLAASPAFFSGMISLGTVYRMSNAFIQVQQAMLFFAQEILNLAAFRAMFLRLDGLAQDIAAVESEKTSALKLIRQTQQQLILEEVTLYTADQAILSAFNFTILPGEKVILMGESGVGKSTLIHCLQGDWPYASGRILRPEHIMVVPQQPYFPIASLRHTLQYPNMEINYPDRLCQEVLVDCQLEKLVSRLDEINDWHAVLSAGEQQCLNLARICLAKPSWVILDEPTSGMDNVLETKIYHYLLRQLKDATMLTISHSPNLMSIHDRSITCKGR